MTDPPHAHDPAAAEQPDPEVPPPMPRWVKISAVIVGVIAVLVIALIVLNTLGVGGDHGPGRHSLGGSFEELAG